MKWINIEESKPQDNQRVLVFDKNSGECEISIFYAHGEFVSDYPIPNSDELNVTHWMPLPFKPGSREDTYLNLGVF